MYLRGMVTENGRSQAKVHRWIQAGANAHISREPLHTEIQDLTRFPSKAQGNHWLIESAIIYFSFKCNPPFCDICQFCFLTYSRCNKLQGKDLRACEEAENVMILTRWH